MSGLATRGTGVELVSGRRVGGWFWGAVGWLLIAAGVAVGYAFGFEDVGRKGVVGGIASADREGLHAAADVSSSPVWALRFSDDGAFLASAAMGGDVSVLDVSTGRTVVIERGRMSSARSLAFAPRSRLLGVAGGGAGVRLWDLAGGMPTVLEIEAGIAKCLVFSPTGSLLVVGAGSDHPLTVWDLPRRVRLDPPDHPVAGVNSLSFSPDGTCLASGDTTGGVIVWDVVPGGSRLRRRLALRAHPTATSAVGFSPDGLLLVTAGSVDRRVRLWDALTGASRGELTAAPCGTDAIAISPDGGLLAVASRHRTFVLWDLARRDVLCRVQTGSPFAQALTFSPSGRTLATSAAGGTVRVWDVADLIAGRVGSPQTYEP